MRMTPSQLVETSNRQFLQFLVFLKGNMPKFHDGFMLLGIQTEISFLSSLNQPLHRFGSRRFRMSFGSSFFAIHAQYRFPKITPV